MDIKQQRARGIRDVSRMSAAAGQLPDQPSVDGAAGQFAAFRPLPCARNVFQEPGDLGAREISVRLEPRLLAQCLVKAVPSDLVASRRRTTALPDDGAVQRVACFSVPQYDGFTLVGNADGCYVLGARAGLSQGLLPNAQLRTPDFLWIVFHPARLWVILLEFLAGARANAAVVVKQDSAGTGRALVKGENVFRHVAPSPATD